jgi:CTP:molybdopterin cytidylyltransferase MocA
MVQWRVRIVAILLAAGEGRRLGGPKALLRIAGIPPEGAASGGFASGNPTTFLARCAAVLARPGVFSVIAVLGHEAERVAAEGHVPTTIRTIVNDGYRQGMLTSVWRGLDAAEDGGAEAILIHPVDHPLLATETVDRVVAALEGGATIAVPSYAERRGHPAGFARSAWPALRSAAPDRGARGVLADHPDWIVHVPGDAGCVAGIDTPEDYRRLVGERP